MKVNERKRQYIESAINIEKAEGRESISIRRLAKELQCNTASLYRCFYGIDELFLYLDLKYFHEYLEDLSVLHQTYENPMQHYFKSWYCFIYHSFQRPVIYNELFFGKYAKKLPYILNDYYSMFPDEMIHMVSEQASVFFSGTLFERNLLTLKPCVDNGYLKEEDVAFINTITLKLYSGYLKDFLDGNRLDIKKTSAEILELYKKIISPYIQKDYT